MFQPKTHFLQVPLETVKKLLEEQLLRESTAEPGQETKQDSCADDELTPQAPSLAVSTTSSRREL